jgi:hypothetical protein
MLLQHHCVEPHRHVHMPRRAGRNGSGAQVVDLRREGRSREESLGDGLMPWSVSAAPAAKQICTGERKRSRTQPTETGMPVSERPPTNFLPVQYNRLPAVCQAVTLSFSCITKPVPSVPELNAACELVDVDFADGSSSTITLRFSKTNPYMVSDNVNCCVSYTHDSCAPNARNSQAEAPPETS